MGVLFGFCEIEWGLHMPTRKPACGGDTRGDPGCIMPKPGQAAVKIGPQARGAPALRDGQARTGQRRP